MSWEKPPHVSGPYRANSKPTAGSKTHVVTQRFRLVFRRFWAIPSEGVPVGRVRPVYDREAIGKVADDGEY